MLLQLSKMLATDALAAYICFDVKRNLPSMSKIRFPKKIHVINESILSMT